MKNPFRTKKNEGGEIGQTTNRLQFTPPPSFPPAPDTESGFKEWKFKQTDSVSEAVKFMNENRIDPAFMFQSASGKISIIYN